MLPNSLYLRLMTNILITTTPTVENRPVREYLGIVSGEAFYGSKDLSLSTLRNARKKAIQEMIKEAEELGANAVIGVKIDYKITDDFSGYFEGYFKGNFSYYSGGGELGGRFGMDAESVWVIATGTAVRL
jgi:uncharacterized protein YbjQ (UPF0145 family)